MKYWNKARIQRERKRKEEAGRRRAARAAAAIRLSRTYSPGDSAKNLRLMLDALGSDINRSILSRLYKRGAMSVTHLAEPFRMTLPAAMIRVQTLERAGLITTHKRGRVRFCVYRPASLKELAALLSERSPFR